MTLKEIVNQIKTITLSNQMVHDFRYGMLSDFRNEPNAYPFVFLHPLTHTKGERTITYSFDFIVCDLINTQSPSHDKYLIAHDRCLKICLDTLSKIEYGITQSIEYIRGSNLSTFNDRFTDEVACVAYNLRLETPYPFDDCISPFNNLAQNEYLTNIKIKDLLTMVGSFRQLTNQHKMLKSFYYGFLSDIKFNEITKIEYPYFFLLPTEHTQQEGFITLRFNALFCDLVKGDQYPDTDTFDNYLDIQSNCIQYAVDIISKLYYAEQFRNITPIRSFSITTFVERFTDELTGATCPIEIQIPLGLDYCNAPF
jgi:hypothetical protein